MNLEDIISGWNGCSGSGGGSSDPYVGYDLVFLYEQNPLDTVDPTKLSIVKGSIQGVEEKLSSGTPANVVLYANYMQDDFSVCKQYANSVIDFSYFNISFVNPGVFEGEDLAVIHFDSAYNITELTFE